MDQSRNAAALFDSSHVLFDPLNQTRATAQLPPLSNNSTVYDSEESSDVTQDLSQVKISAYNKNRNESHHSASHSSINGRQRGLGLLSNLRKQ